MKRADTKIDVYYSDELNAAFRRCHGSLYVRNPADLTGACTRREVMYKNDGIVDGRIQFGCQVVENRPGRTADALVDELVDLIQEFKPNAGGY